MSGLGLSLGLGMGQRYGGGGTPVPTPELLALDERVAVGGNSWEAQNANLDIVALAWAYAGCRGLPSLGMNQSRGGDRLTHLLDRIEPLKSIRAGAYVLMNPINDFSDALVTNNQAGADVALARLDAVIAAVQTVKPSARFIVQDMPNASGGISKATARAAYNAGLTARASSSIVPYSVNDPTNPGGAVDLTNAADSSDGTHPDKVSSAKRVARALGAKWASLFVADDIFAGGLVLPNAVNRTAFSSASAWTATANSSGLTATQSDAFLRSRPTVPARVFTIGGTAALAETVGGSTADLRLRLSIQLPIGFSTDNKAFAAIMLLEIKSTTGGAPVGLATLQLNNGVLQTFNKQHTSGESYLWDDGWEGPIGMPAIVGSTLVGQTGALSFDITLRGKQGVSPDLELRVAALNLIDCDAVAYGPVASLSKAFTSGRPLMAAIPSTTPAATVATGGTIAKNLGAFFVGGGLTYAQDAMRAGTTDVGDIVAPTNAAPSGTPYTTVAGDTGQGIRMRQTASNNFGGGSSAFEDSNLVSVT